MIEAAARRNAAYVDAGRAQFIVATFEDLDLGNRRFDKIFAVRVGLFHRDPEGARRIAQSWLRPSAGRYPAFFDPPPRRGPSTRRSATISSYAAPPSVARVTRPPSLWIDREGTRDPDAGPFSQARWRRQAHEAEARWRAPEEQEAPEPPPGRPRRGRLLVPALALTAAVAALGLSAVAVLDGGENPAGVLPAAGGGKLAPTQVGRVYQSAGPGVVSVQVGSASGTGFVVRDDGTIVTNAHVVGDAETALVRFGDTGRQVQARGAAAPIRRPTWPSCASTRAAAASCARCRWPTRSASRSATRWSRSATRSASTAPPPRDRLRASAARSRRRTASRSTR